MRSIWLTAPALALALGACNPNGGPQTNAEYGPNPQLPAPHKGLIPTVKIAKPVGWPAGQTPVAAPGLQVAAFAVGLAHPRWIYVLPNGDVLVAETNGPSHPPPKGLRGLAEKLVMGAVGAEVPSPNRIVLLRPGAPGAPPQQSVFITGLNSPFGMALVGDTLYVANTDAILAFPYQAGETAITAAARKLTDLPGGPIDHHWTKNIIASPDGKSLFVTVGSNSNVGENGIPAEAGRAAIWKIDLATGAKREFATGIRNPNGMDWQADGTLWTVANERDELGDTLVPDYLTSVRDGAFYGWPYSYWGQHVDVRPPPRPDLVAKAISPDYALGDHVAPLGLVFYRGAALPAAWRNGAFIGEHGSWNRSNLVGYKVVFVPFAGGKPAGTPRDVLTGFLGANGVAYGRPVGVAEDPGGALLVADDVGNAIWRVTAKP